MAADARTPVATTPGDGPSLPSRVVTFYHQVMVELRKVTWPDRKQVQQATIAIIVFVLLLGLFIWLLDVVLQQVLVKMIPSLFTGR